MRQYEQFFALTDSFVIYYQLMFHHDEFTNMVQCREKDV